MSSSKVKEQRFFLFFDNTTTLESAHHRGMTLQTRGTQHAKRKRNGWRNLTKSKTLARRNKNLSDGRTDNVSKAEKRAGTAPEQNETTKKKSGLHRTTQEDLVSPAADPEERRGRKKRTKRFRNKERR